MKVLFSISLQIFFKDGTEETRLLENLITIGVARWYGIKYGRNYINRQRLYRNKVLNITSTVKGELVTEKEFTHYTLVITRC